MKRSTIAILLPALLCLGFATLASAQNAGQSIDEQLEELRDRFDQRHDKLLAIKDAGKVGETVKGYVRSVRPAFLDDKVGEEDSPTIRELLEAENRDRRRLYELLAEKLDEKPEEIAVQNAIRNFKKADPEHFLRLQDGTWIQKKAIEQRRKRQE